MRRSLATSLCLAFLALPAAAQETPDALATKAWLGSVAAQLQLAASQQAAFQAYADAIAAQAALRAQHRTEAPFVNTADLPPAPQALEGEIVRLRARADALAKVQAAAAALYQELSAQQRTAFDFLAVSPTGTGAPPAY